MDRRVYFYQQSLASSEVNAAFAAAEDADRNATAEGGATGIVNGLTLSQTGPASLNVSLLAGVAYSKAGVRMAVVGGQTVPLGVDESNVTTAVSGSGNAKWLSVFLTPARAQSDPRTDGNGEAVYFVNAESYRIRVVQGVEGSSPARPPLHATDILIADVRREYGVTTITDAAISTDRTENVVAYRGSSLSVIAGSARDAFVSLVTSYDDHISGGADRHTAADIDYAGGSSWADGSTNPAGSVETTIDNLIFSLRSTAGAAKLGASGPYGAVTVQGALTALGASTVAMEAQLAPKTSVSRALALFATNTASFSSGSLGSLICNANTVALNDVPLSLPQGAVIKGATVRFTGAGGHAGLPANKPQMILYKVSLTSGSGTAIGSLTSDPSASVGAYETGHSITMPAMSETVDNSQYAYFLRLYCESGTNYVTGGTFRAATILFDIAAVDITH